MQHTAARRTRRAISIVGALALIAGMVGFGTVASGAWFTATKSASATVTGALLTIGEIGKNADQKTIAVADVYPMTDAQAAAGAKSEWITVRNTGTIPLDWTMAIINPQAKAPLTAAQLANFRFRLFDERGAALTAPQVLGSMPAASQPGLILTQGSALAAGGQKKVEIRVWLTENSQNEFQGAGASFDVIINGIQNGGDAPALTALGLTAAKSGTPSGASTALRWNDAKSGLSSLGYSGTPTYTVQRSRTSDFSSPTTVYTGTALAASDTTFADPTTALVDGPSVAAEPGDDNLCTLGADGSVFCRSERAIYQPVDGGLKKMGGALEGVRVVKISAGARPDSTNCAISDVGALYCWGQSTGIAGGDSYTPALVNGGALAGKTVVDVISSEREGNPGACAVTSDGVAACWGYALELYFSRGSNSDVPVSINYGALAGKAVRQISFSAYDACARTSDNIVACWGSNRNGLLGNGTGDINYSTVAPVRASMPWLGGASIIDISGASGAQCALTSDNRVFCWGQMWPWNQNVTTTPTLLNSNGLWGMSDIEAIASGVCAVAQGVVYCWGFNYLGTLGSNVAIDSSVLDWRMEPGTWRDTPTRVTGVLAGKTVKSLAASSRGMRICAVSSAGEPSCWGKWFTESWDGAQAPISLAKPTATTCPDGGTLLQSGKCGLSTSASYYYRVSYVVAGVAGWSSPFYQAARS